MIVTSSVGAAPHTDDPSWLGHLSGLIVSQIVKTQSVIYLVVDFSEGGSHLIGESPGHDDDICLPGRGSEHDAVPVHVVSGGGDVHHLHCTARQTEC